MNQNEYRLAYHLMPPSGWMNDPNGLCYYQGAYHVFFQYAPMNPVGKTRYWGHYLSRDLISWEYVGIAIKSDNPWDRSGAYSGCGFTEDGIMELFYTGNVKEDGDYDYVLEGRGANVITVKSTDGMTFFEKELLLTNKDYPSDYTCHVRDPKIWKSNDTYYMLLGGRKKGDKGAIIQYESKDKVTWTFSGEVTTKEPFGYMWECPDAFTLDGKTIMVCCPQGVPRNELRFQNIYQSGYFVLEDRDKEHLAGFCDPDKFIPWDYGYDFYAPQTMKDQNGRIILYGWAGMPDMDAEYNNQPTIEEGWQHSLTLPRELKFANGLVRQYPVEELNALREQETEISFAGGKVQHIVQSTAWDLEVHFHPKEICREIVINNEVAFCWEDGMFTMLYKGDCGMGRKKRQIMVESLEEIRILFDVSMFEVYINHGEYVLTTRYFPKDTEISDLHIVGAKDAVVWNMKTMEVLYNVTDEE